MGHFSAGTSKLTQSALFMHLEALRNICPSAVELVAATPDTQAPGKADIHRPGQVVGVDYHPLKLGH